MIKHAKEQDPLNPHNFSFLAGGKIAAKIKYEMDPKLSIETGTLNNHKKKKI